MKTQSFDLQNTYKRYQCSDESVSIIEKEELLPIGLLKRLHACYTHHSFAEHFCEDELTEK